LLVQASLYIVLGSVFIASHYFEIDRGFFGATLMVFCGLLWMARINDLRPEDL